MAYIDPETVLAPKNMISDLRVIYDRGTRENSWSVATFRWMGREAVGIRWNGNPDDSSIGTPQARGIPTWFIVPEDLADVVLETARSLAEGTSSELLSGYEAMAGDREREREAHEWAEGLIGDAHPER